MPMNALVSKNRDLILDPGRDRKPMNKAQIGNEIFIFSISYTYS